ncbi:hypothetical protein halTADL_1575 [Halohasta litchfieldiae]|jgi:hypothetical protein|uniref:Uncharacterized protein n=2 Tax=Haloferacaceae TaxID=1644056 RepID=B9LXD1_HALLT|nr:MULTISPECIES: hypothetical protein [Halorubraceae]ACM59122.1 hypothetical protein Hlac_3618 [Halorubrum lacusprofundi ATCC 49239]ATW88333.1 hypothetical protein halTADL_1575 [Halohasta litchfieldiae]SEJ25586.1 hypothetical protein SAMN05444271_13617 [Halohasta litchfieldiae]
MPSEGDPALPDWIENAYLPLERYLCEQSDQDAFTHHQATELIAEANPDFRDTDIDHALNYLHNHGWLYKVDDLLFITELQCAKFEESTE